jgi:hypothetical protein
LEGQEDMSGEEAGKLSKEGDEDIREETEEDQ